jgi:uncharacterized protein YbjT (DUF2867 family)
MILVTGATGTIGRKLIHQLQDSGATFKAFVRSEDKGRALGCEYAVGDFDQPETLAPALRDVEAVFLNGPAGDALIRQQSDAIAAARASGVKRIVKLSSRSADPNARHPIGRVHGQVERVLADSGVAFSVLRPGTFMQNLLRNAGTVRSQGKLFGAYKDGRISFVDVEDIAACGARLLQGDAHNKRTFTLSGPEAVSFVQIADKLASALGKPVSYVDLPPEQMAENMKASGMPAGYAEVMVQLMVQFSTGAGAEVSTGVSEILGRPARSIEDFIADNLAAFR